MILFEDEHLLVINKPPGMNTHAPSPFAGEGIYEWLRNREPRWADLAIMHRLDKETSGVLLYTKSAAANRSLTEQFSARTVEKKYVLRTDRPVPQSSFTVVSNLARAGARYHSQPGHSGGQRAETRFHVLSKEQGYTEVQAEPLTGRTHQIRVHASEHGFPIVGDTLYGGTPAARVYLHASELIFKHPIKDVEMTFEAPAHFGIPAEELAIRRRELLLGAEATNSYRLLHGASDRWPGWYVDRFGEYLLSQSETQLTSEQLQILKCLLEHHKSRCEETAVKSGRAGKVFGVYHKILKRGINTATAQASPILVLGEAAPDRFLVQENGVQFELSFQEGYSVGLFLDQRDNRRRFLINHVAAHFPLLKDSLPGAEVLNTFAYTCGFSVCAAKAGARTTSIDLSKKYLEWGKRNFLANQTNPAEHDFIHGDVFEWLRRLLKKQRQFDVIVLDPPTFSRSKASGSFQVGRDYGKLVLSALPLLKPEGVLFASTNAVGWAPEKFLAAVSATVRASGRKILQQHYVPQPPDLPISPKEPAYLKTVWMRIQ